MSCRGFGGLVASLALIAIGTSAHSAEPATKPCDATEFRAFDFWVGEWRVTWKTPQGQPAEGRSSIQRVVAGCAIEEHWQGKDGPRALFSWREGSAAPITQDADEEIALPLNEREALRLPETFVIYSHDCPEHRPVEARGRCVNGVWAETGLLPYRKRR